MKKFLLSILVFNLAIFTCSFAATVTWDGGAGTTNWMDATNWDTDAIPAATDDADLDGNTVTLSANTTVQRVYAGGSSDFTVAAGVTLTITGFAGGDDGLEIQGSATVTNNGTIMISNISGASADGLYVKGLFTNTISGMISISATGEYGIYVQGGNLVNEGTIMITDFGLANSDRDGICADDNGGAPATVTNDGSITITMTSADDGIYVNDGSAINNNSMIMISGTGGDNGIRVDDGAAFNNNIGGTFTIGDTPDDQLFLDNDGAFNNAGTVNLDNASDVGLYVTDQGIFTNMMNANVNITGASNFSMQVDANFSTAEIINSGTMSTTGGKDGLRLQEGGTFTNMASGTLDIDVSNEDGINIQSSGGTLDNSGFIDIAGTIKEGMDMAGGTFNNMVGGIYQAANCVDDGLEVNVATVNNDGEIRIFGSGSDDIETFAGFTFINSATATFGPGNSPGEFELKGSLDLGASTTTFEIAGTTHTVDYDRIENFTGSDLTVSAATAHLDWGTYVPAIGDCFDIVAGGGNVVGTFASITTSNADVVTTETYSGTGVQICVIDVLPVELVYFKGERTERGEVQLSWMTATEINNEGFDVEKSIDGENWDRIGYVHGNGTTTELIEYAFLDETPYEGTSYYRLKQNDFDGKFDYSNTVIINQGSKSNLEIYPNPVKNTLNISGSKGTINIYNSLGQIVYSKVSDEENLELDMTTFANGTYYIVLNNESSNLGTLKFVKY